VVPPVLPLALPAKLLVELFPLLLVDLLPPSEWAPLVLLAPASRPDPLPPVLEDGKLLSTAHPTSHAANNGAKRLTSFLSHVAGRPSNKRAGATIGNVQFAFQPRRRRRSRVKLRQ
jgi:hypothetical protein